MSSQVEYLRQHDVPALVEKILQSLVTRQPAHPPSFICGMMSDLQPQSSPMQINLRFSLNDSFADVAVRNDRSIPSSYSVSRMIFVRGGDDIREIQLQARTIIQEEWGREEPIHELKLDGFPLPKNGKVMEVLRSRDVVQVITNREWIGQQLTFLGNPWMILSKTHKLDGNNVWAKVSPHCAGRLAVSFGETLSYFHRTHRLWLFSASDLSKVLSNNTIGTFEWNSYFISAHWELDDRGTSVQGITVTVRVVGYKVLFRSTIAVEVKDGILVAVGDVQESTEILPQSAPQASHVKIIGPMPPRVGSALMGTYTFSHQYQEEGQSRLRWLRQPLGGGAFECVQEGQASYLPTESDIGHILRFEVHPTTKDGVTGVASAFVLRPAVAAPPPRKPLPKGTGPLTRIQPPPVIAQPNNIPSEGGKIKTEVQGNIRAQDIHQWSDDEHGLYNSFAFAIKVTNPNDQAVSISTIDGSFQDIHGKWNACQVQLGYDLYNFEDQTNFKVSEEDVVTLYVKVIIHIDNGTPYDRYNDRRAHHSLPQPLVMKLYFKTFQEDEKTTLTVQYANEELSMSEPSLESNHTIHYICYGDHLPTLSRVYAAIVATDPKDRKFYITLNGSYYSEYDSSSLDSWLSSWEEEGGNSGPDDLYELQIMEGNGCKVCAVIDTEHRNVLGLRLEVENHDTKAVEYCRLPFGL